MSNEALSAGDLNRRSVIKRAAVVGAATAWATPVVQTVAAPAFAAGSLGTCNETTTPGMPVIGTATPGVAGGAVTATASWTAPADNGGCAITGYVVRAQRLNTSGTVLGTTTSAVQPADATSLEMALPVNGALYRFAVRALNAAGTGAFSTNSNAVIGR